MDLFTRLHDLATAVRTQLDLVKARLTALETAGSGGGSWGSITGTLSAQTDLQAALDLKASTSALAPVATSGAFADLTAKPTTLAGYGITNAETAIALGTTAQYWRGDKSWQTLDKTAVGLANVDNTSDANKPVSTAQQTALDAKANLAGGNTFTGDQAITGGELNVDKNYPARVGSLIVQPAIDAYPPVQFADSNGIYTANIFGGSTTDRTLYLDCDHIVLEDYAEANVYIDATAAQVDIKAGNATKLSITSTGAAVTGVVTASGAVTGSNLSGTNTGDQFKSIANGTILGNNTGSTGAAIALTAAQTKTLLGITESDVANLTTDLAAKAPLANPQFTGVPFYQQPSPTAVNSTATLTIAQLLTLIITTTSTTAVSLTLPTGTLTDAGILSGGLAVNEAFEWYIINLGSTSGAVTLVAGTGHTIVGSATVAIGTSARFLTRKTATNTFVTYRIA